MFNWPLRPNLQLMIWVLAVIKGISYGLFLGLVSFGPTFFALMKVGIQGGKNAGLRMALGIFLSDLVVALACFFGLSGLFTTEVFQVVFSGVAASGIVFIGVKGIVVGYRKFLVNIQKPINQKTNLYQGFLVNLLNPFVLLLWVGILGAITVGHNVSIHGKYTILVEMLSILLTIFSLDLAKVYLSDYIGKKLNYRIYFFVNRYIGWILIGIGLFYFYHFTKLLYAWFT